MHGREIFTIYDGLNSNWLAGNIVRTVDWPLTDGVKRASAYYRIDRLYSRDAQPVMLDEAYLADDVKRELGLRRLRRSTILRLLDEESRLHCVDQRIRFGVADQALAQRLKIELNASLAIMELWVADQSNTIIYFARAHYRGDIIRIREAIAPPKSRVERKGVWTGAR
jgi:DNA-binding GntR family transcriptional regulator